MSASSSRCGAIVSQSEKARNANSFFDRLAELLNSESVETTNRDDMEPPLRAKMRLATDHLQQMIRLARQFHQYRFSDDPQRCGMAAEVAGKLVYLHNKLHRGDVGAEFLEMVTLFDRRAKYTPQPDFFGFHHKSWAGVVNKIMLQHYCPFDDAFEASALSEGITAKQQESGESESALWTPEAFALLCQRLDENPIQILSFTKSSWGVEQEPGKQSGGDDAAGRQGNADAKCPPSGADTTEKTPLGVPRKEHPYRFECGPEIVRVVGLGEGVALERTEGVERLIAIVTRRRVNVMDLARIGAPQQGRDRSSVDVDADRLSERESVNDERFESRMGDDSPSAVREAVCELIEQRDAASARGDDQGAGELTAQINAALQGGKAAVQTAAGTVRKSLGRTYDRLRKGDHGISLAKHFEQFVDRPRNDSDFVYAPDESHGKILWTVK